jgi:hypothetical protein
MRIKLGKGIRELRIAASSGEVIHTSRAGTEGTLEIDFDEPLGHLSGKFFDELRLFLGDFTELMAEKIYRFAELNRLHSMME